MVSKIVNIGNKVEFTRVQSAQKNNENSSLRKKVYVSQVYDIIDETKLKVAMPIENGHIVAVSTNTRLDACFYTSKGLYHGRVVVIERMKENNIYSMIVELQYELKKFQRRQYYRLSCTMDLKYRLMEDNEYDDFMMNGRIPDESDIQGLEDGVALDFSGGGVRFISDKKYNKDDFMYICLKISYDDRCRIYLLAGRVIASAEGKNGMHTYENRVEFVDLDSKIREEIIKYIFNEERRQRKMDVDFR